MAWKLLSTKEAAEVLGITARSVVNLVHKGDLTPVESKPPYQFTKLSVRELERARRKAQKEKEKVNYGKR